VCMIQDNVREGTLMEQYVIWEEQVLSAGALQRIAFWRSKRTS